MTQILVAGLSAGVASALLFASTVSGTAASMLLLCLASLPVTIAALGWHHWAGLLAALSGAVLLAVLVHPYVAVNFLALAGIPGWGLGYLALLGRPVANGGTPQMEWYPPGRLVLWAALYGAAVIAVGVVMLEGDEATLRKDLGALVDLILHPPDIPGLPPVPPDVAAIDPDLLVTLLARVFLPLLALLAGFVPLVNLWLAGHVVRFSGRLPRPWPDLAALSLPRPAAVMYAAAIAAAVLLPGLAGIAASGFVAALTMAFAVGGLALLHALTRGMRGRAWMLAGAYAVMTIIGPWPMTAVGLGDTVFDLRRLKRGPGARQE